MGLLQQTAASRTQRAFDELSAAVNTTSPGRVFWRPLGKGEDVLAVLARASQEVAQWAEVIEKCRYVHIPEDLVKERIKRLDTQDKAVEQLQADIRWFLGTIRAVPDDALEQVIEVPTGHRSLAECLFNVIWALGYHEAQITYIQSLYQD